MQWTFTSVFSKAFAQYLPFGTSKFNSWITSVFSSFPVELPLFFPVFFDDGDFDFFAGLLWTGLVKKIKINIYTCAINHKQDSAAQTKCFADSAVFQNQLINFHWQLAVQRLPLNKFINIMQPKRLRGLCTSVRVRRSITVLFPWSRPPLPQT